MFNEGSSRGPRICRDSSHGVKEIVVTLRIFPPRRTVGFSISREFRKESEGFCVLSGLFGIILLPSVLRYLRTY